jgi:hypothetical protein
MNKKIMAVILLTLTGFAAVIGGLLMTAQATETEPTATDTTITTNEGDSPPTTLPDWGMGEMMMPQEEFGRGFRGHRRGEIGFGGITNIEISSEYNATVTDILEGDSDVQNLISEGYTIQSINPKIKTVIEADGTVVTKATTATVFLQNGTLGLAAVKVDVTNAKVTEIVIITRTIIDKTSG